MWPSRRCAGCRRMVHYDCDPQGQSSLSSPHSSSSPAGGGGGIGVGSEDTAGSNSNYLCPSCRNRDSATPSEVSHFVMTVFSYIVNCSCLLCAVPCSTFFKRRSFLQPPAFAQVPLPGVPGVVIWAMQTLSSLVPVLRLGTIFNNRFLRLPLPYRLERLPS